jgi:LysR family transcriptional regulator, regulator for genes of the gallate degradation pathway
VRPNLRHLQCFQEIARLGSLSAAARAVHLSQPAVTQAVARLEHFFAADLLSRRSDGVSLTDAGELCRIRIERALTQLRDALGETGRSSPADPDSMLRLVRSSQLDALGAVVESGTFSGAARRLGASQSSVHRAARELEGTLGLALFEKTSFGVTPTRDAERLARRVRLAFAELSQARMEIRALEGSDSGRTVIAALPLARSYLVPAALLEFSQGHPDHAVEIIEGTYSNLLAGLRSGESDLLIGALRDPAPSADVVQEHLFDDPLAIIARAHHPLAGRRPTVASLRRYQWIAPRKGSPLRAHFDALLASRGMDAPAPSIECNSLGAARAFLLESDRLMLLSAHQIHYEMQAGLLIALPHPHGDVTRPIGLTLRRDWRPTSVQERLLEVLRRVARAAAASHARKSA